MEDERINRAVGAELRAARARRGWSRDELSERVGVSVPSIRRYESGARSIPVDTLVALIGELGIKISDIDSAISEAESAPDPPESAPKAARTRAKFTRRQVSKKPGDS